MKKTAYITALLLASFALTSAHATNYEYSYQPNLAQIQVTKDLQDKFYQAYIAPSPPKSKLIVAILDGLADYTHVDLTGHETDVIVYNGLYRKFADHATHVSGIIGAAQNGIGVVGVDPFATLLDIPVFDDRGWVATDLGKKALDKATSLGARVVNMSYGSTVKGAVFLSGELNLFQAYNSTTAGKGMLLVRAAGNDGVNIVNQSFSGNAATALSNLLIVGSVNSSNMISTFSNRPGNACIGVIQLSCGAGDSNAVMNFFIVAPGENILSDLPKNYLGYMSGTSMATPHVVGAAALVFQQALAGGRQLTPGSVADILKKSADDLGAAGVDPVYGWGLLDVARALNPVGGTFFPTGSTSTSGLVTMQSTTVTTSSLMGMSSMKDALSGIIVLDGYGRAYTVNAPQVAQSSAILNADFVQDLTGAVASATTELQRDGDTRMFLTGGGDLVHGGVRVLSFDRSDLHFDTGLVGSVSYFTSPDAAPGETRGNFSRTMAQDFYAGSGDVANAFHQTMFLGADFKTSSRWTFSGLYQRSTPSFDLNNIPTSVTAATLTARNHLTSSLLKIGANYQLSDGISVGIYSGYLGERAQTLGMRTGGAFSLGDGTTYMGGINFSASLTPTTTLSAFAEQSTTVNSAPRDSIFAATDNWSGSKYGISVSQVDPLGLSGIVQLKLVRPWQIDNGYLRMHVPVGRELDGTIDYQDHVVSVAAGRAPMELDIAYLTGSNTLKYGAEVKMLDHSVVNSRTPEVSLAAALHWSF